MIKRIELINFMSHTHTVIHPAQGLTVLVGPNNCGKSAVMSALQILAHNDNSTYVIRHGEKECSIIVETSEGDVIEWKRKRSSTSYIVNGKTFDRLKGKVPPEVSSLLKLPKVKLDQSNDEFDIHFGNQKKPIFLINESGRAAAGFFAASSDASRLIEMQKLQKQKAAEASRDLIRFQDDHKIHTEESERLAEVPAIVDQFETCSQLLQSIEIHNAAIDQIKTSITALNLAITQEQRLSAQSAVLATIADPPNMKATDDLKSIVSNVEKTRRHHVQLAGKAKVLESVQQPLTLHQTNRIEQIVNSLTSLQRQADLARQQTTLLNELDSPPLLSDVSVLKQIIAEIDTAQKESVSLKRKLKKLDKDHAQLETDLANFTKTNPRCPTCNQAVTESVILQSIEQKGRHEA